MSQRPVAIGLLLCEQVIVEARTGNITPVNCFLRRTVSTVPSEGISFIALAFLTDGSGTVDLEVTIQRLDNLEEVYRRTYAYRFQNPLQEVRFLFRVRDCSFPVAGEYQLSLLADGELLAQRKLRIVQEDTGS